MVTQKKAQFVKNQMYIVRKIIMSMTFYFNPKSQQNAKDKFKIHLKHLWKNMKEPFILKLGLCFTEI